MRILTIIAFFLVCLLPLLLSVGLAEETAAHPALRVGNAHSQEAAKQELAALKQALPDL